jgi:competence ComEA-like helix-hairpin-helix protein
VSTTPTAEGPSTAGGAGDARSKYARQIEEAFEAAGKLAGSALPPTEFYQQFLNRTLSAIDAPAGAVWLRTPQGFLQLACQENFDKIGLDNRRGGRQCHNEVLRQVFQAAPPRPVLLEPNGRMAPGPGEPGPVPPANLTDHFALFAPIISPDKQPLGLLEVFQDATHDPRMYPTFLNYTLQMAGYASQYHQFSNARVAAGIEKTYSQVETFARDIHGSLNPTEVAYHVANEGRKLIECDRLCVGVRHDRWRVTVEAVSGADVVEKASTHVRRLRDLMEAVLQWGETLTFRGQKDPGLPPAVATALDAYLHESQPKLLIVQPCRDERETDKTRPARAVLVMECFNPPEQIEPIVSRLEVVTKHAAPALYNAAELKRVPLKFLWWPIAKVQEGVGGKRRFIAISVAVLLALIIGVMAAPASVPPYGAQLRMEAKGQLQPVEIVKVFPPREIQVRDVRVKPGDKIDPGYEVAAGYSSQFEEEYSKAMRELAEANAQVAAATTQLSQTNLREEDKLHAQTERNTAQTRVDRALQDIRTMDKQYNDNKPNRPGYVRAVAPPFDANLARTFGASRWTVLNDDRRENLVGRTLRPNEEIVRIGNLEGAWQIKLDIPQRNVGQVLRAFNDADAYFVENDPQKGTRKYLKVDVLLSSQSDASYEGWLYRDEMNAEAVPNKNEHDENEPVVSAYVKLNVPGIGPKLARELIERRQRNGPFKSADDLKQVPGVGPITFEKISKSLDAINAAASAEELHRRLPGTDEENWIPRNHFVTGLEVRTRVRCGKHAIGYTLFHGVWEWFYEKVIFFF